MALLDRRIGASRVQTSALLVGERTAAGKTLAAYGLLNLRASYPLGNGVTVFDRIDNVTNEQYTLVEGYTTPGRQYFIGLRYASQDD